MNYLSPVSWICALLAALIPFIVLLRPSLTEFIVLMIVDSSVLFVTKPIESTLFLNFYPETKYYLRKTDEQAIANFSLDQKISLYQSFVLFPKRRARFCHIGSFIKVIPAYLVMTFYWEHEISNLAQFSLVVGISLVNLWFFYAAVFLEAHIYLSDLIRDLHEKFDFSDVFSQAEPQYSKYDFLFQEVMNLLLIITFTLSLQSFVILSGSYRNKIELAIKLVCIGFIGTCLFIRIWQLSRKYHFGALETLFQQMEVVDGKQANVNLPLHTAPLLARFEKTFNLLMQRLRVSEQELSSLVVYEADKGRSASS
jgi:hypothetical protein